jgi:hypothetical protein
MPLTKTIQAVIEGSPVSSTYKPVKAELTTLLTEMTNGTIGVLTFGFTAHTAGTLALALNTAQNCSVTPNATGTFTTTVPPAGTICHVVINTSGTTSYTMTFGTGFRTVGTLATGTVSARTFVLSFISDGTSVIETARTTAI